jgi:hypothetical protein
MMVVMVLTNLLSFSTRMIMFKILMWIMVEVDLALISEMQEIHTICQVAECSIVDVTFPYFLHLIVVVVHVLISSAA